MATDAIRSLFSRLHQARAALLSAAVSYYFLASLLPLLVLVSGVLGLVGRQNEDFATEVTDWLGVKGSAAEIIADSVKHAEQTHVLSSLVGILGLLWVALAASGALRRAVDAVWFVEDVGWTARLRTAPWAAVALGLIALSTSSTGFAALSNGARVVAGLALGWIFTLILSWWFVARLGNRRPNKSGAVVGTMVAAVGIEAIKNAIVYLLPRLVSRESALYGGLGTALAILTGLLVLAWLLLIATAVAAEITDTETVPSQATRTQTTIAESLPEEKGQQRHA